VDGGGGKSKKPSTASRKSRKKARTTDNKKKKMQKKERLAVREGRVPDIRKVNGGLQVARGNFEARKGEKRTKRTRPPPEEPCQGGETTSLTIGEWESRRGRY